MKLFYLIVAALCTQIFISCNKPEQIPAYLDISAFEVNATGGAGWQKITEGWVYVNGDLLGAYTLPASVPVLVEGTADVQVFPGVKENGILATPSVYNIMSPYKTSLNLISGQSTPVKPVTKYNPDVVFTWEEDKTSFDGSSSISIESRDPDTVTNFVISAIDGFSGKSLSMTVDTAHALIEIATESVVLPKQQERQTWLELHYKNDMPYGLWLLGNSPSTGDTPLLPVFQFNNSDSWKKIYLNLTNYVSGSNVPDNFKLVFKVSLPRDEKGNYSQLSGHVQLDNIRLIHF